MTEATSPSLDLTDLCCISSHRDATEKVAQSNSAELASVDSFREPGTAGIGRGSAKVGSSMFGGISHPPRASRNSDPGSARRTTTSRFNPNYQPPTRYEDRPSVPGSLNPIHPSTFDRPAGNKGVVRSSFPTLLPGLFPQTSAPAMPINLTNEPPPSPKIPTMGGWFTSKGKVVGPGGINPSTSTQEAPASSSPPDLSYQSSFPSAPLGPVRGGVVSEGPMSFGKSGERNSQPGRLQMLGEMPLTLY